MGVQSVLLDARSPWEHQRVTTEWLDFEEGAERDDCVVEGRRNAGVDAPTCHPCARLKVLPMVPGLNHF